MKINFLAVFFLNICLYLKFKLNLFMRKSFIILLFIMGQCSFSFAQNTDKHLNYLDEESSEIEINSNKFYYVTKESDSTFMENIKRSLITFVKEEKSVSIDELEGEGSNGKIPLNNSCGIKTLTYEMIKKNLNDKKNYRGIDIKRIKDQKPFNINQNEITGVMLYSKKIRYIVEPYLKKLNELNDKYGINFILITLDSKLIDSLSDSYQNVNMGM